jgi:hypothetical protein
MRWLALVIGLVGLLLGAVPVEAARPQPITITTHIVFDPFPPTGTFTATDPICPSGTFEDEFIGGSGGVTAYALTVRKHFTCDDGSGTFTIQFHPQFNPQNPLTFDESGPWAVVGKGTGAYATLRGHGDFGVIFNQTAPEGTETFMGFMSLD